MGEIVEALAQLVMRWRVGLAVLVSTGIAIFLASALQWFSGAYGIALVLFSLGAGMLWQGSVDAASRSSTQAEKSGGLSDQ